MSDDLEKLCKEIKKKAHKIEVASHGESCTFYFLTPDDSIYQKFSELSVQDAKKLMQYSGISLSYVDIKNNFVTQYSEHGAMGDRYTSLPAEQRKKIEAELNRKKRKKKA